MTIGERIRNRRLEIGMSVDDVAKFIGKNRATVYRYESNDIENLPISILEPISKALRCSPAYLMGWGDDPYDYETDTEGRISSIPSDTLKELLAKYNGCKSKAWKDWWDLCANKYIEDMNDRECLSDSQENDTQIHTIAAHAVRELNEEDAEKILKFAQYLLSEENK